MRTLLKTLCVTLALALAALALPAGAFALGQDVDWTSMKRISPTKSFAAGCWTKAT